ncbi:MAG: methyltransferase [Bacteroidota bacterium]
MTSSLLLLVLIWVIYFFLHSFLAATGVKAFFSSKIGLEGKTYRLMYNFISGVGLLVALFFNSTIQSEFLINPDGPARAFSLITAGTGVLIIRATFKSYDLGAFLGFREESDKDFKQNGMLKYVRHPLYSGTILVLIGFWLFIPNVPTAVTVVCHFVYLAIGIRLEEHKLISLFGEKYLRYKQEVPMLVPRIRLFN